MKAKLLVGGIGGLIPAIPGLIFSDAQTIAQYIEHFNDPEIGGWALFCGYIVRVLVMFSLGAFWAYLHRSERNLLKIFQLGIVAPAILGGIINSSQIVQERTKNVNTKPTPHSSSNRKSLFVNTAFANEVNAESTNIILAQRYSIPERFRDGFIGRVPPIQPPISDLPSLSAPIPDFGPELRPEREPPIMIVPPPPPKLERKEGDCSAHYNKCTNDCYPLPDRWSSYRTCLQYQCRDVEESCLEILVKALTERSRRK